MNPEEISKFYREKGLKENFVTINSIEFPVIFNETASEPNVEFVDKKYAMDIRSKSLKSLLEKAQNSIKYNSYVSHIHSFWNNTITVWKIPYDLRTMFEVFSDEKLIFGKTLRELTVDSFIGENGKLVPINEYPFPKPFGAHVMIIHDNNIYLQKRSDAVFNPGRIDPTAGGAVDYGVTPRKIIEKELAEEAKIDKISNLRFIGYMINLNYMYDISFLYVANSDQEPRVTEEVSEFIPVSLKGDISDEIKHFSDYLTENTACFISYFSRSE